MFLVSLTDGREMCKGVSAKYVQKRDRERRKQMEEHELIIFSGL